MGIGDISAKGEAMLEEIKKRYGGDEKDVQSPPPDSAETGPAGTESRRDPDHGEPSPHKQHHQHGNHDE